MDKINEAEHTASLKSLWENEVPSGTISSQKATPEEGMITFEQTEKGDVISRSYNHSGVLTAVEWREPGGEFLIKTFFDDGSAKGNSTGVGDNARFTLKRSWA